MKHFILIAATGIVNGTMSNGSGISDYLKSAIISTTVTALISIIGFIVTYMSMKRNFKNELSKQKSSMALDKMSTVPYETLELHEKMMMPQKIDKQIKEIQDKGNQSKNDSLEIKQLHEEKEKVYEELLSMMSILLNKIYSYGSEEAIKIIARMQQENYLACRNVEKAEKYRHMAFYILLATQVKLDVTGVAISPQMWYQMRLTDYVESENIIKVTNNKLVSELNLNSKFII